MARGVDIGTRVYKAHEHAFVGLKPIKKTIERKEKPAPMCHARQDHHLIARTF